jgi:hypothetical protein
MKKVNRPYLSLVVMLFLLSSCSISKKYPQEYYKENMQALHDIEYYYKTATENKRIGIAFNDLDFQSVTLEIKTDTVRYVYNFDIDEKAKSDTLIKYGYNDVLVDSVVQKMRRIRCTWVNKMSYYSEAGTKQLIFMSVPVRQFALIPVLRKRKYYLFNFYEQPQYYDEKGRLLDKRIVKRLRKVNREIFYRITNKVAYTISNKFR